MRGMGTRYSGYGVSPSETHEYRCFTRIKHWRGGAP